MWFSLSIRNPGWGAVALSAGRFGFACTFSEGKKSCCSALIRRAPAPTHTLTHIHPHTHTHSHTPPRTHIHILSMAINHLRNVHAIICIYTPDATDANLALAQCARRFAAASGLKSLHSFRYIFLYRRATLS